jgi:hypothetical protein
MASIFKLRRGSDSVNLEHGELYVHSASLQYGDSENDTVTLLPLGNHISGDINLTGSINLSGSITASDVFIHNNLHVSGNLFLGNNSSDNINTLGVFTNNLIPGNHEYYDIGSEGSWWRNIYVNTVSASFISGSIAGIGNINEFSESVDFRLDTLELSASLYDNAMSGSKRLYVSPSGSDANDGSDPSVPFRTIKAAVESLGAAEYTNTKRYTIFVGSGEYVEQNPITVPPGVAIVGDTLRTVRLYAANPTKDYFHTHDSNYFYGLRFLDLKHPAFAFSFPSSTATSTISGGSVSTISVVHSMTGYTDGNNQDIGIIIEGPDVSGSIATATANIVGGVITQINVTHGGTNYGATEKPHISIPAPLAKRPVITTSPYIQNCSSITGPFNTSGNKVLQALPYDEVTYNIDEQGAGGGIRIDGNLVHPASPLESFVADAFTQVNQGGPGHLVINKGYAQFVSCFTTFCTYGFKTANGGFANISNSVIDFGAKGLISKTYFPQTYNTGSSLEEQTSQVSGIRFSDKGAGYTGSTVPVQFNDGGYSVRATGYATVNNDTSLADIVITNSGSGYTSRPTIQIDAPTAIGNRAAIVVDGYKADISGVTQMLMSLESGSRGVDISSNMILNGVDYLVTDVAVVSGQPNQRRVTTYPAPPSIAINDQIKFHQLSNISTGGLVMEYVGSGVTYNALPKFGGVPIRTREIDEIEPGRVFYSTVDNIGNLKIGEYFAVNQLTGEVTINANSFNLSGLNAIGPFRRNGAAVGVVLQEVSNNTTLVNAQGLYGEDTVPTQYAVKGYIDPISSSLDARLDLVESTSSYLNTTFSSSVDNRLDLVEATASYLNTTFSTSVDSRLDSLETAATSDDGRLDALETYSASLKTAIAVSGQDLIVYGNLAVQGTQTSLNVNEVFIEDKTLTLASGSTTAAAADGAGIHIAGANVTMSWDNNNNRINLNKSFYVNGDLSGSTLIGIGNVRTYSASVDSRLDSVELVSASAASALNGVSGAFAISQAAQDVLISSLRTNILSASVFTTFSTSVDARLDVVEATSSLYIPFSTSVNSRLTDLVAETTALEVFTASANSRLNSLQSYTASVSTSVGLLQATASFLSTTFSTSVDARLDAIEISTASLNNWTGSTFVTFSTSVDSRIDLTEATSSYLNTTFSTSVDARLDGLEIQSASFRTFTASVFQPFSTSVDIRLDGVEYTASLFGGGLIAQLNTLNNATASLQNFSSSINTWTGSTFVTFSTSVDSRLDNLEGKDIIINLGGDLSGSAQSTDLGTITLNGFIAANSVALGTDTSGSYIHTITGTSNQITVAGSGLEKSDVTLSLPQNIHTGANVQFNSIGVGMAASATAGRIDASGDIVAFSTSDINLKENIIPIPNALEKVNQISGNTFDWKEELKEHHGFEGNDVGVIAQEIEEILPQIVTNRDSGYKAVQYEKIIPLLIEAVKELSAKVDRLENK